MTKWYGGDLAYIHDVGHADFALRCAPEILGVLARSGVRAGLVVDLGCGSGLWARELVKAGYGVLGIDISEAMVEISRQRVPEAEFRVGSLFETEIPPCAAVTAVSEVLNYLFVEESGRRGLASLFRRVYGALRPGGLFVFDLAGPGQLRGNEGVRTFSEGEDWAVLLEKEEDRASGIYTRRIVSFRALGGCYRREEEIHRQQLFAPAEISDELRRAGFRVRTRRSYGAYRLPRAHAAFIARKPA